MRAGIRDRGGRSPRTSSTLKATRPAGAPKRLSQAAIDRLRFQALIAALATNLVVAILKAVAAYLSGSTAVLASVLQSASDSVNSVLLLVGFFSAMKPPDDRHPYGYGKDAYFWSLVAALIALGVVASASVNEGIDELLHPSPDAAFVETLAFLGVAMGVECIAVAVAIRSVWADPGLLSFRRGGGTGFLGELRAVESPTVKLVLIEDTMALIGIVVAFLAVLIAKVTGIGYIDGIGAIVTGALLGILALTLAREFRSKLIGTAADPRVERAIRRVAFREPPVRDVADLRTMVMGADRVLAHLIIELDRKTPVERVGPITAALARNIAREVPQVAETFIEVIADEDPD